MAQTLVRYGLARDERGRTVRLKRSPVVLALRRGRLNPLAETTFALLAVLGGGGIVIAVASFLAWQI